MRSTGEVQTIARIARCAGKLGKELVAGESPNPASREMEAERNKGNRTASRKGRTGLKRCGERGGWRSPSALATSWLWWIEYMLPPGGASRPWMR